MNNNQLIDTENEKVKKKEHNLTNMNNCLLGKECDGFSFSLGF